MRASNYYANLYDSAPFGYVTLDDKGYIKEINLTGAAMLGEERSRLPGKQFIKYVVKGDRKQFRDHLRKCEQTNKKMVTELGLIVKGGSPIQARLSSILYHDEEQQTAFFRTAIIDITESKKVEQSLRESQARLASIVDTAMDGIITIDADQRIVMFNSSAEKIFRCTAEEAIGKLIDQYIPERFRNQHQELIRSFGQTNKTKISMGEVDKIYGLRANGEEFPMEASVSQIEVGGQKFYTVNHRDITERKKVEDAGKELLKRLIMAQEDAQHRISRELHDQMGQYLTALTLGLESLKNYCQPSGVSTLEKLQQFTSELGHEVHSLALKLRPTALDDLGLQTALLNYIEDWSEHYKIEVNYHSDNLENYRLSAEIETILYRVVQEALTNVVKHAKASSVSIILERRSDHVLLIIEDNGCGFDVEAVMNLSKIDGRLGLLGMQERVMLANGTFNIESTLGKGTTIFCRIPITKG